MNRVTAHAAIDTTTNVVRQLDTRGQPDEIVTLEDAQQPMKLARLLTRILAEIAALKRRFAPKKVDFKELRVTPGGIYTLQHNLNGDVNSWIVRWRATNFVGATWQPFLLEVTAINVAGSGGTTISDANTLVLLASGGTDGIATVRVEEAG